MTLTTLEAISLDELLEKAELQTRVDRKYVLPLDEALALPGRLAGLARILEIDGQRTFRYRSVYFDTPELTSFRLAATRRRRRFKVRTRTYVDSALCWLEVKTEGHRGGTVKDRLPYAVVDHETVAPGRWFVDGILGFPHALAPTLVTDYRRATLHVFADDSRLTIDTDLGWQDASGNRLHRPDLAIVETKTRSAASGVDRMLWADGRRPVRISKYATGLAALRPDLPAVPWRRTLRRFF
ncbi:polyphosphate polymerase domain-containing protein [Paractinoplanes toevensis]|uniref:VTC domain-containing protein n=1 Tax=Paractinoplanes toevensis TaxID=571911 RepID=A0A919W8Z1_9ACTN|nr:polyphosphate polymerase domain-containing protein [Actinoplanes toevensis]GIM95780.1 VTC domain-containing protein [Actinoplanes toevensis]